MSTDLLLGIIAGLVVAVALVVMAVMLRPSGDGGAEAAGASSEVPTAIGPGPAPAPAEAEATASTPVSEVTVRLRLGPDQPDSFRDALRAAIDASGYAAMEFREMPYPVDRPRIQYYAPSDQAAAEALSRTLAPVTGGPVEIRDLGEIAEAGQAGSIDAWLAAAAP